MSIGVWQILLVLLVVMIVFGAGKLPRVMGDVGRGLSNFKREVKQTEDEITSRERN